MSRNRVHEMSQPVSAVSLPVCCLVGVFLLYNPASALAQLIQIGEPERVFSMDNFPTISSKLLNCLDVNNDGSKVAFCPHPSCGGAWPYVYQTNGQGGEPMRVGPIVTHSTTQTARFNRDGTKLFFGWRDTATADVDIWQVNIDGSSAVVLIGGPDHQLAPCPVVVNGQDRIVYRKGWWPIDLWSADMAGGDRIRLSFEGNKSAPRASVDGTKVVYFSQSSAAPVDVFLMNSDGSGQRQITNDGSVPQDSYPALVQNDQAQEFIVYSRRDPATGENDIWITDLLGVQSEPLIAVGDRNLDHANYAAHDPISPYGAIYYTSTPPGSCGITEVWRVGITGTNVPPTCNADGPYAGECDGITTDVPLDGSASSDPNGDSLTFLWTTDCPGGSFDDETSDMPILSVDTGCGVNCNVTLAVDDGNGGTDSCSTTVTIADTQRPVVTCSATPIGRGNRGRGEQELLIEYSAWDGCGDVTGSAVIETRCCPLPVVDGQVVKIKCKDHEECKLDVDFEDDTFKIKTDRAALVVTATDECGNTATCEVDLCIPDDDDSDGDDDDDGDDGDD